jgi:hypothetical protein
MCGCDLSNSDYNLFCLPCRLLPQCATFIISAVVKVVFEKFEKEFIKAFKEIMEENKNNEKKI